MKRSNASLLILSLFLLLASACRADNPPDAAALGDTWTRPSDGMVMVYVPGGSFAMGSDDAQLAAALQLCNQYRAECDPALFADEQPVHPVTLSGFWLDQTEVANDQYRRCVEAGACTETACADDVAFNGPEQPVVCVTWQQAADYCEWAGGRLPTEAEWEYAARGPDGAVYPWGDVFDGQRLNYCDVNCNYSWADGAVDDGYSITAPVGSLPGGASWCDALDMAGNVWEWVADWHGEYTPGPQTQPPGPADGVRRVLRGGSWDLDPVFTRAAARNWGFPDRTSQVSGFRCAYRAYDLTVVGE